MSGGVFRGLLVVAFLLLAGGFVAAAVILMARGTDNAPIRVVTQFAVPGTESPSAIGETDTTSGPVLVYVHGAVQQPGVYSLKSDSRLVDALDAAGGPTEDADLDSVNLAQRVKDEGSYYVPAVGERVNIPAIPSPESSGGGENNSADESGNGGLINLNTASAQELEHLPGIGPVKARAIVDYRNANVPFASVSDIVKVPGIGDGIYQELKDMATVEDR